MERASMIQDDECTQTLTGLGLTLLQAKTYLAFVKLGKADVKTISKASNVARQDIYRIMPTLQKLGLAEQIIANPTMYNATPIKEGLSILLQNRQKEYAELKKKTTSLINNFHANTAKTDAHEEDTQFKLTSEATLFLKMHKSLHQKAQMSIDAIIPLIFDGAAKFIEGWSHAKKAIRRGIKIRLLTQKTENELTSRELQALEKHPLFELKYLATPVPFGMHIFDNKEVTLATSESGLPSLWSNNRNLVKLAASYFDEMWSKAQETPHPKLEQKRDTHAKAQHRNIRRRQSLNTQQS
jgi:sugar-specific transcriptional regulator TrmB